MMLGTAIEKCYLTLDRDLQGRSETEGGPVDRTASVIVARLFGFDEQLDREMRLSRVEPLILLPIAPPARTLLATDFPKSVPPLRTAEYRLQNHWAEVRLAAEYVPPEVRLDADFTASILCLRYKRVIV